MDNKLKIRRVSRLLRWASDAYLILKPLLAIAIWLNFDTMAGSIEASAQLQMEFVGPINLLLGFLVNCIPMGLMLYGVWHLRQLFGLYTTGIVFTVATARHLHTFATILLITVITSPLIDILQSFVLSMNHPEGERMLSVNLSSADLGNLFLAGVMFAIAWIMREGHRLAAENEAFV